MRQNPTDTDGLAPQRSPGPQALRRRVRRVGAAAAHSAQHDCSAVAQTRRRAQPARVRGLPDADDTPLHATDHARHAQHPVNSGLLANSEVAPETAVPRGRDATAATA